MNLASLNAWANNLDRERREEWGAYEVYCREIERVTGADHYRFVSSEIHKKAQHNLGLHDQYSLCELPRLLAKFSHETIRKAVSAVLDKPETTEP